MDNIDHDNLGVEDVTKVFDIGKDLVTKIKTNKKRKEAEVLVTQGEYWFLSPAAKALVPIPQYVIDQTYGKGITQAAILNYPKQPKGTAFSKILPGLQLASGTQPVSATEKALDASMKTPEEIAKAEVTKENVKKYLPYVIGAIIIGLIIWLTTKK